MAFIDEMRVHVSAGHGGPGVVRWLHIKGTEKGGPAGGDGGNGGDVLIKGVRDFGILARYRFTKKFRAENGHAGQSRNMAGRNGEDLVIEVPIGTIATNVTTGETYEILEEGHAVVIAKGGIGGYGNAHFKGATNQNPMKAHLGRPGHASDFQFTVKLIADAGFIGLPNAGKSSLVNALTNAKSKVGGYPFTTLDPHLGDLYGFILADIPGLIEGAHEGKGLGTKFLRHIERTRVLVHLVSVEHEDVVEAYKTIRTELEAVNEALATKREIVVLTKTDLMGSDEVLAKKKQLEQVGVSEVHTLSTIDDDSLKAFQDNLIKVLRD